MSRAVTDQQLHDAEQRAEKAAAEAAEANIEAQTIRSRIWEGRRKREETWDRAFTAQLADKDLRHELHAVEEDARQRMRQAIVDGDFSAALKAFTQERAARWRAMRLADEGNAASTRTGGDSDRFHSVAWVDPRFYEVVLDVVEEVAQQRAEDEIDELQDQRDEYVRGERVELPMGGGTDAASS
ncbi:MAG: hypothetical protein ACRDJV_04835 [Actinomycetota bacterium]